MLVSGHACNRGGSELADGQRSRITWIQTQLRSILAQFAGCERGVLLTLEELDNAKAGCNYAKKQAAQIFTERSDPSSCPIA